MSNVAQMADYRADGQVRPLPANVEAEQALLGAILLNNEAMARVESFLKPEHFSEEIHKRIFEVAASLIGQKMLASPITLKTFLGQHDLGGFTVPQYLARLAAEATTVLGAHDYGRTVYDLAVRRGVIAAVEEALEQAFDAPADMRPAEIARWALDRLGALIEDPSTSLRVTAGASAQRIVARAQAIMRGEAQSLGVSTGIPDLDDATGGYRPGELWIGAGRPGMGKTVFGSTTATKVARKDGDGAMIFSLELPEEQYTSRLLADMAYLSRRPVTFQQIMRGDLDDDELWMVDDAQRRLSRMAITVDYSSRLTVADIRARVHAEKKRMAAKGQTLRIAIVDYLKFVQAGDRYRGNRVYEVGEISAGLKQLAKDEEVCILLLAQLNRALEARDDKRPGLSDLRESGDLEQDADVVAFMHRDAYYVEKSPAARRGDAEAVTKLAACRNEAELILGKNRNGPTKTINLFCDIGCSTLSARARGYE